MAALITALEDAILARLAPALTREGDVRPIVELAPWPGRPNEYRMVHPIGAVLVMYKRSKYPGEPNGMVEWSAEYEVGLFARNLRTHQAVGDSHPDFGTGAYDLLQACRDALAGVELPHSAGQLALTSEAYAGYKEGVWAYTLGFSIPMISVIEPPEVAGPFTDALAANAAPLADLELQHPAAYFPNP